MGKHTKLLNGHVITEGLSQTTIYATSFWGDIARPPSSKGKLYVS